MDKAQLYEKCIKKIQEKMGDVEGIIPRMATVVAVLKNNLPHFFWCGFYFAEEDEMIIGPYQGTSACPNIGYSGVCGASAKKKKTVIVPNVHDFPGHIACDEASQSEIVVPLMDNEKRLIAVLDVDSDVKDAFDTVDKKYLEKIVPMVLEE